jgi:hypothetical protein
LDGRFRCAGGLGLINVGVRYALGYFNNGGVKVIKAAFNVFYRISSRLEQGCQDFHISFHIWSVGHQKKHRVKKTFQNNTPPYS